MDLSRAAIREVINAVTGLQGDAWRTATGAALALVNRRYGLLRALTHIRPTLELWDRMPEAVVPIAGADAHGGMRRRERMVSSLSELRGRIRTLQ